MGSRFGKIFAITTFGESHGGAVGVVIEGVPSGIQLDLDAIQSALNRRRPGQSDLTSPRNEADQVECLSGTEDGMTLGSPVTLMVRNRDQRPTDYQELADVLRPSHADYTTLAKYGVKAKSGGGRSSARETIGRVAAGAVAEQILKRILGTYEIAAWVQSVAGVISAPVDEQTVNRTLVDQTAVRCPDLDSAKTMIKMISDVRDAGDSVGGTIRCVIRGVPAGLGEPVFDKVEADLAKAMLSLPATKGFEIGSGFIGTTLRGSAHNDAFVMEKGTIRTATNHSGGIQGGMTNGEKIVFNVAFKPVATIAMTQNTLNAKGEKVIMAPKTGRHDPCVLPRAVPMVEAMANLVLADHLLRDRATRL